MPETRPVFGAMVWGYAGNIVFGLKKLAKKMKASLANDADEVGQSSPESSASGRQGYFARDLPLYQPRWEDPPSYYEQDCCWASSLKSSAQITRAAFQAMP